MNNILLVYGGNSVEHEISIITALQIINKYKGKYNLIPCYHKNSEFYISKKLLNLSFYKIKNKLSSKYKICFKANKNEIKLFTKKIKFEAVWIISHGKNCEDGTLVSFFKTLNINVISENIYSATIGHNKLLSKKLVNVPVVPYAEINEEIYSEQIDNLINQLNNLKFPLICKPSDLGSSIGVLTINTEKDLHLIKDVFKYTNTVVLERKIDDFEEYNIALFKVKNNFVISAIEKVSNNKVLSYDDKYLNKEKSMSLQKKEIPAVLTKELKDKIISFAKIIYNKLQAEYLVRIDFLYDKSNGTLYFNEINNIPGSLAYYLFEANKISFDYIVDTLLDEGLIKIDKEKQKIITFENNIFNHQTFTNAKLKK